MIDLTAALHRIHISSEGLQRPCRRTGGITETWLYVSTALRAFHAPFHQILTVGVRVGFVINPQVRKVRLKEGNLSLK